MSTFLNASAASDTSSKGTKRRLPLPPRGALLSRLISASVLKRHSAWWSASTQYRIASSHENKRLSASHDVSVNCSNVVAESTSSAKSETACCCIAPSVHAIAAPHERARHPVTYASHSSNSPSPLPRKRPLLYTSRMYRGRALPLSGSRIRTDDVQSERQSNLARVSMSM